MNDMIMMMMMMMMMTIINPWHDMRAAANRLSKCCFFACLKPEVHLSNVYKLLWEVFSTQDMYNNDDNNNLLCIYLATCFGRRGHLQGSSTFIICFLLNLQLSKYIIKYHYVCVVPMELPTIVLQCGVGKQE
jgi:hypothetical protein